MTDNSERDRMRDLLDQGFEDGLNAAMEEVFSLVTELRAEGKSDLACTVFDLVWRRLRDREAPMLAQRKANRVARDAARLAKQS